MVYNSMIDCVTSIYTYIKHCHNSLRLNAIVSINFVEMTRISIAVFTKKSSVKEWHERFWILFQHCATPCQICHLLSLDTASNTFVVINSLTITTHVDNCWRKAFDQAASLAIQSSKRPNKICNFLSFKLVSC